jgi:hypothetical protein
MNQGRLKAAERMVMDIAAPLPAIMTLVDANEDEGRVAIMILLKDVNNKAAELCEVLDGLQRDTEPSRSA